MSSLEIDGKIAFHAILHDLSARKKALDIITQEKKQIEIFALAMEQSQSSVIITDLEATIEYVNQAFINNTGYSREEIIGSKANRFKSGKTPKATFEAMWLNLNSGKPWQGEIINKDKFGQEFIEQTWITPIKNSNGTISHYLSVKENITERKKIKAELTTLSIALEQCQSSVMITDLDAHIEYVNQAFVNITGYRREELIGQKPSLLKSNKTPRSTYDEMWTALHNGKAWHGELINLSKQGEELIQLTWISPICQTDGTISHYLGVQEDITERKKQDALLLAAKERAENLAKTKSQFLANMSHEIRTPMSAIIGFSDLALLEAMPATTHNYLQDISTASKHLLTILNDILDLSKLEAGQMSLQLAHFNLADLQSTLYGLLINTAQEKGLSFIIDIDAQLPQAFIGDNLRLRQVLINLLGNAIKFTQQGSVTLKISLQQLNASEARLLFSVIDTGMGISAEQQNKLFQPFSQVDDGFSRNFEGTGLGLTISQDLVQLMGGSIKLDSNVDLGSCFSFEIVLALALFAIEAQVTPISSLHPEPLSGVSILVAEDDAFNQKIITQVLENFGARVVLANNGLEALAALEQDRFDVVLMDLHMPRMNGYEATLAIRKQNCYAQLPVITLSASVTDEEKQRCLTTGMNAFVGKPINKIELLTTLEQWLN
jgi:PAS domain S-box-containing protein